jgi:hypothetical protein
MAAIVLDPIGSAARVNQAAGRRPRRRGEPCAGRAGGVRGTGGGRRGLDTRRGQQQGQRHRRTAIVGAAQLLVSGCAIWGAPRNLGAGPEPRHRSLATSRPQRLDSGLARGHGSVDQREIHAHAEIQHRGSNTCSLSGAWWRQQVRPGPARAPGGRGVVVWPGDETPAPSTAAGPMTGPRTATRSFAGSAAPWRTRTARRWGPRQRRAHAAGSARAPAGRPPQLSETPPASPCPHAQWHTHAEMGEVGTFGIFDGACSAVSAGAQGGWAGGRGNSIARLRPRHPPPSPPPRPRTPQGMAAPALHITCSPTCSPTCWTTASSRRT